MDAIQRLYARTALTGSDPLAGVPPRERFDILTMRPTWHERLRLLPLQDPYARKAKLREIIAERRIKYELALGPPPERPSDPTPITAALPPQPLSPFQQRRLATHQQEPSRHQRALSKLVAERAEHDAVLSNTEAVVRAKHQRHATREAARARLQDLERERSQLIFDLDDDPEPLM